MDRQIRTRDLYNLQDLKVVYYMPIIFEELQDILIHDQKYENFYQIIKSVNPNSCVIDRTNSALVTPFPLAILDKIPLNLENIDYNFEDVLIRRATELLKTGKSIRVLYSGGLDSTAILLALWECVKNGIGEFDQIIVCCNTPSILENEKCWIKYILPFFKIEEITDTLNNISLENIYVMGENADQIFGAVDILNNLETMSQPINDSNLKKFISKKNVEEKYHDHFLTVYKNLVDSCPINIKYVSDLIWWMAFSCGWQSGTFTALSFTQLFDSPIRLDLFQNNFRSFYNTEEFQKLSLNGSLKRWGDIPTSQNYKLDIRNYIKKFPHQQDWADQKVKSPSLYRALFVQHSIKHKLLATDTNYIYSLDINSIRDLMLRK